MKVNFTPIPHPTDENVNLNLRRISDAFKAVVDALGATTSAPTATSSAFTKVGSLTANGTISGIPATARSLHVVVTGESLAGCDLDVTVNGIAAGYLSETPPASGLLGPVASWPVYAAGGGAAFAGKMDIMRGPGATPTAFFQSEFNDAGGFYIASDGQVACPSPISSLTFVATAFNQMQIDVWALL